MVYAEQDYYHKLHWPSYDQIILDCGHRLQVSVMQLENPDFKPTCYWCENGIE